MLTSVWKMSFEKINQWAKDFSSGYSQTSPQKWGIDMVKNITLSPLLWYINDKSLNVINIRGQKAYVFFFQSCKDDTLYLSLYLIRFYLTPHWTQCTQRVQYRFRKCGGCMMHLVCHEGWWATLSSSTKPAPGHYHLDEIPPCRHST